VPANTEPCPADPGQHTRLLVELCEISSASGDLAGIRKLAERVAAELSRHGLAAQVGSEDDGTATRSRS